MPTDTTPRKQPQDRKPKTPQRAQVEAELNENSTVEVAYGGDIFTVEVARCKGLEFLAALEDEDYIPAMRLLLGREQAALFFKGREVQDVAGFFDALGEVIDSGN